MGVNPSIKLHLLIVLSYVAVTLLSPSVAHSLSLSQSQQHAVVTRHDKQESANISTESGGDSVESVEGDNRTLVSSENLGPNPLNKVTEDMANSSSLYNGSYVAQKDIDDVELNLTPVIGILAQELGRSMRKVEAFQNYSSYIAASYVKSVESAGARVVPILINQEPEYYRKLAGSLNGVLFPGGSASITNSSGYGAAGGALYQLVLASNDNGTPMPLWATCLGFEMLVYLAAGGVRPLTRCHASNRADPLLLQHGWEESRLFKDAPDDLMVAVQTQNITTNFHKYCVTPETFNELNVSTNFKLLSLNMDDNGMEYVSTIEHRRYPLFGTQWHPEKTPYEWMPSNIPHTPRAIQLEKWTMEVFVQEARNNYNSFSPEDLKKQIIYNYSPTFTRDHYRSSFQQCYFF